VALSVEYRTCDQEVGNSRLGRAHGQVSHTCVPLSSSSESWYRPKGARRLGR